MKPYIQAKNQQSTLEHWKTILAGNKLHSFAAFAYVTDSGVAQLGTHLGPVLGATRGCRWLFGVDYGRSHPTALRRLAKIGKSTVRIHDGAYVVQSTAFIPRVSFHLKTALTLKKTGHPSKQIVGSGNLSASGLLAGIEAGCVIDYTDVDQEHAGNVMTTLEKMWEYSTPLDEVIDDYEAAMEKLTLPIPEQNGYECYDGKILTFQVEDGAVVLEALEHEDFFQIYGKSIGSCSEMQSGRRYGTISLP
jgi:HKD family nuclease